MDRFLATEDSTLREQSIEITREVTRVRARLHQLRNHKVSEGIASILYCKRRLTCATANVHPIDF
jgi:hypothetical protein